MAAGVDLVQRAVLAVLAASLVPSIYIQPLNFRREPLATLAVTQVVVVVVAAALWPLIHPGVAQTHWQGARAVGVGAAAGEGRQILEAREAREAREDLLIQHLLIVFQLPQAVLIPYRLLHLEVKY